MDKGAQATIELSTPLAKIAIFYCSFPLRALLWKALLNNVGYGGVDGRRLPSIFNLTRSF